MKMNNMKRITGIIALSFVLWSCARSTDDVPVDNRTPVDIEVSVAGAVSRSVVEGTTFANGQTYGLFICENGTYSPHNTGSNNIRATYSTANGWNYNYEGGSFTFSSIFIMSNDRNTSADFYAYSPWLSNIRNPEAIAFSIGGTNNAGQSDLMWAEQNGTATNKNIKPDGIGNKRVELHFNHALSCLRFCFKISNAGAPITLSSVRIRQGGIPLYNRASLNAIDGTVTPTQSVESFVVSQYNIAIGSTANYSTAPLLIVPTDEASSLGDDDTVYGIEFTFDGAVYPSYTFLIPRSRIVHGDGTVGFRAGYEYRFYFTIDNFLHLDGVEIDDEWHEGEGIDIII